MTLQLPNLDDRRWVDLVDDGRALIPQLAPEWTDHNVHDPGITVIELLASIAELDIYQLNQISDRHRQKFLALIGVEPRPPRPARGAIAFRLKPGATTFELPSGTELVDSSTADDRVPVRTLSSVEVLPFELRAVIVGADDSLVDVSSHYTGRAPTIDPPPPLFGPTPAGQAVYLGFHVEGTPTPGSQLRLYLAFDGPGSDAAMRQRLVDEQLDATIDCPDPSARCAKSCSQTAPPETRSAPPSQMLLRHHDAVAAWEYWHGVDQRWTPLEAIDDTRSFTLDGAVVLTVPEGLSTRSVGSVLEPLYYFRCRHVSGEFDVPPVLRVAAANAVEIEQAIPVWQSWTIAAAASIEGTVPAPGARAGVRLRFDAQGRIDKLAFVETEPHLSILAFDKAPGAEGRFTIEAVSAGLASGTPNLRLTLNHKPLVTASLRLLTLEGDAAREWQRRPDFAASTRKDAHYLVEPTRGTLDFGDGERGRAAPNGARVLAEYLVTGAELGNLSAAAVFELHDSPRNRVLLGSVDDARERLDAIATALPLTGGEAAESLAHAIGRAVDEREASLRAVTLHDYETLTLNTPGTRIARATARANFRPGFDCVTAGGHVAVLILPDNGAPRPGPSLGLRQAVRRRLERRRIIGTRVEVFGPDYVEVAIRATVAAFPRHSKQDIRARAIAALTAFLHPIRGGPDGSGWPFGRDVYRAEVLEVLDQTEGVDRVESLELVVEGCDRHCGNVCLPINALVAAGPHEIEVV